MVKNSKSKLKSIPFSAGLSCWGMLLFLRYRIFLFMVSMNRCCWFRHGIVMLRNMILFQLSYIAFFRLVIKYSSSCTSKEVRSETENTLLIWWTNELNFLFIVNLVIWAVTIFDVRIRLVCKVSDEELLEVMMKIVLN